MIFSHAVLDKFVVFDIINFTKSNLGFKNIKKILDSAHLLFVFV